MMSSLMQYMMLVFCKILRVAFQNIKGLADAITNLPIVKF